ncbi:activator of Hsp90 ATPase [Schizophyllum commune]
MSSMPLSTANWHWKNKNVTRWGKEWFERELATIAVQGEGEQSVKVDSVSEVDGDVELGQRKSKLITIYDCKLTIQWSGKTTGGEDVKGRVVIPEVSHENTLDGHSDVVYEWSLTTASTPDVDAVFKLAKARLPAALEAKFAEFPVALVQTHGKDIQVGTPSASGTSTPATGGATPANGAAKTEAAKPVQATKPAAKTLNYSTVETEASFMASAADLFSLLTDEARIPAWTRAPAQSKPQEGTEFSLFGGGVKGKFVSLKPPTEVVQTWALQSPTWPAGHFATLTMKFDQASDSTKLTLTLDGVPKGMEDEIRTNLEGYYIHGLKSIGYVPFQIEHAHVRPSSYKKKTIVKRQPAKSSPSTSSYFTVAFFSTLVVVAAFGIPWYTSSK